MSWEFEIQRAYLQKLADKILPGTIIRSTDVTKKAFKALQEPKIAINAYASGGFGGGFTIEDILFDSPSDKGKEWSLSHSGERVSITLYEKDTLEAVKETAEKSLKDLRTMVSKRTPEI